MLVFKGTVDLLRFKDHLTEINPRVAGHPSALRRPPHPCLGESMALGQQQWKHPNSSPIAGFWLIIFCLRAATLLCTLTSVRNLEIVKDFLETEEWSVSNLRCDCALWTRFLWWWELQFYRLMVPAYVISALTSRLLAQCPLSRLHRQFETIVFLSSDLLFHWFWSLLLWVLKQPWSVWWTCWKHSCCSEFCFVAQLSCVLNSVLCVTSK